MPIFKEVNESYFGPQTLRNVLNYVLRSGDVGGLAVDPAHAHEQMLLVKQIWNKLGGRQIRHFIVSFAPHEFLLPDDARTYAYQIARYYSVLGSGEINHSGSGENRQFWSNENHQSGVASPQVVLFTRPAAGQPVSQ